MIEIDHKASYWNYLSEGQRGLILEGIYLLTDAQQNHRIQITDYSYIVFPFAKAYEGFLKQLFFDMEFISEQEYNSDHFRIGRALNPHFAFENHHGSVYQKVIHYCGGQDLAEEMWMMWKRGRNLVFHYFPHNYKALLLIEAEEIIVGLLRVMEQAVKGCKRPR
jgi:hypothetical protein